MTSKLRMPRPRHQYAIFPSECRLGFLIEASYDTSARSANYQRIQGDWIATLEEKYPQFSYLYLIGDPESPPLDPTSMVKTKKDNPTLHPFFKNIRNPHVLYYLVSKLMTEIRITGHFLQVPLPPCPQYRSLIWWLGYYYLVYQYQTPHHLPPLYWIHLPDVSWVNFDRLANLFNSLPSNSHLIGTAALANPPPQPSSILIPKGLYPEIPYHRPFFSSWVSSDHGFIISEHALRVYLQSKNALYLWTDIYPDKSLTDVVQCDNKIRLLSPLGFISAIISKNKNKKVDPSWRYQNTFMMTV